MKPVIFLILLLVIIGLVYYSISFERKEEAKEFSIGFNAVIKSVEISPRKYHVLTLLFDNYEIKLSDNLSRDIGHEYQVGDSIIKKPNTCSYFHKRNSKIIFQVDNCTQIYISNRKRIVELNKP